MIDLKTLSNDQLSSLIAEAQAELSSRTAPAQEDITATIKFGSYNDRRYSRPWIAVVTKWPTAGRAEMRFGNYLGNAGGGICEVACSAGDLIRYGQKDGRGGSTVSEYAVALGGSERLELDEVTAAAYYRANAERRAELVSKWLAVQAEKYTLLARSEGLLNDWRADQTNRQLYLDSNAAEKAAKELRFEL